MFDEKLKAFASERQREIMEAVEQTGGAVAAARLLGINQSNVSRAVAAVKAKAALQGYSPEHDMTRAVPDGFRLKGTSTYYNRDGRPTGQWVKNEIDPARQAQLAAEAVTAALESVRRLEPIPAPLDLSKLARSLLTVYSFYDFHFGMHAWGRQTGDDWDLGIAAKVFNAALSEFIGRTPPAKTGVLNLGGDLWHYDSMNPVTNRSGNVLDADGRKMKMLEVTTVAIQRAIDLMLHKHENVILLIQEGNHDEETAQAMQVMFAALYANEPRVEVVKSPLPYYVIEHGETMLGFHHGHLKKLAELPALFAALFRAAWGRAKMTYIHTGHYHHAYEKEHPGAIVTQHPTLTAPDRHSATSGYVSHRAALAHTYRDDGEIYTVTHVSPKMMEEAADALAV